MKADILLLIPFDLGLELDFGGRDAEKIMQEVTQREVAHLAFAGRLFEKVQLSSRIYKFGIGLIQISFSVEGSLDFFASLSCRVETVSIDDDPIQSWARRLVHGLLHQARKFASHTYDQRLDGVEIFPIFVLEKEAVGAAAEFIGRNEKALYGIVSGEPNYDNLSQFVVEKEKLDNFGYYEEELILIRRFGAVISSKESGVIIDLIRLAYSIYWDLKAYNNLLDRELDQAQSLLSRLPPYFKFWKMPGCYQRFSADAIAFGIDKLAIVDAMHNVAARIPRIDSDWHLRTIFKYVEREFDIDELARTVEVKLDRIEGSYNSARDFLSTNFFIAVEVVLILSLVWMVLDTCLLFVIAQK